MIYRSLRASATLFICLLVLGVVLAFAAGARHQMNETALDAARDQLASVSRELSAMLAGPVALIGPDVAGIAGNPAVVELLRNRAGSSSSQASAILASLPTIPNIAATSLLDPAGRTVLEAVRSTYAEIMPAAAVLELASSSPGGVVGPLVAVGDSLYYHGVAAVRDGDEEVGYVVRTRYMATTPADRAQLQGLIGSGVQLYIANSAGDLWTDLSSPIPSQKADPAALGREAAELTMNGVPSIASAAPIEGAPWTLVVARSKAEILQGPSSAVRWLMLFGGLLVLAGAVVAWVFTGRVTRSIGELGNAAESISSGDYSRRARVSGTDELGRLGSSFNRMADSIGEAHQELQIKVAELALTQVQSAETQRRMAHVLASSRTIIYKLRIVDGAFLPDWISGNVKWIFGHEPAETLRADSWSRHVHPEDRERYGDLLARFAAGDETTLEYRLLHADGSYRWVRDEQRALRGDDGRISEVVGALTDISEQRTLECAKEAAESANLAKSDFLSRMSHELRTPMNAILGFAQLLDLEIQDPGNRESVEQILRAGRHLLQLIDEVLDISRIEARGLALPVEPVSIHDVVRQSLELVTGTAEQRGVRIRVDDCSGFVRADQQRLKQVLLNFLSNAIKFNREEGEVRLHCHDPVQGRTRISVSDSGRGITPEAAERLFIPFERLGADQAGIAGTGLGLALSRGLATAMGGEISFVSTPGKGSTFWIELPSTPDPESTTAEIEVAVNGQMMDSTERLILYIEDNVSNLHLVERLLSRRRNFRVVPAMQGRLGLELAREHRPDLILLDVHLSDLMGYEVLRELQMDPGLRDIPVVVVSADATKMQIDRLIEGGARDYVTKPYSVDRLMAAIDEALTQTVTG